MMLRTPPPPKRPPTFLPSSPSLSKRLCVEQESGEPGDRLLLPIVPFAGNDPAADWIGEGDGGSEWDSMRCSYNCRQLVKSELLEKLDSQERQIVKLDSTVNSLKEKNEVAEVQRTKLLARTEELEQELAAACAREKAVHSKFAPEMDRVEEMLRTQLKRCNELELKLQEEMRQRAEADAKASAAESQLESARESMGRAAEASLREIRHLKEEHQRLLKDSDSNISRALTEASAERRRLQAAQAEAEAMKALCEELQNSLSENMDVRRGLESKLASATLHTPPSPNNESDTIIRHLRDELSLCEADIAEAQKLKHYHVNADVLREKLESERQRAERAEAALGDLADLQLKVKDLECELQAWRNIIHELPGVENRDDIPRKIASIQREAVSGMARLGELSAEVKELQVALANAENARHQFEDDATAAREEVAEMQINIKRLERKVQLLTKEREGLKSIIASYDEEEAVMIRQRKLGDVSAFATPDKSKDKRIQELEALVADLEREEDNLRSEIFKLESKLGHGDYNPVITKVLHMRENLNVDPEKHALLLEVDSLRKKVEHFQNTNSSGEADDISHNSSHEKELLSLREQVSSLEKRQTRYKKVFAEKISVFRTACCLLFGYEVQMNEEQHLSTGIPVTLLTLQSVYAQNDDEKLQFQYESGHMNLLANDYTSSIEVSRMVEIFLQKMKSIPAFTANLTVELFNRTTMG